MQQWLRWLEASALAIRIRDGVWLYPVVETIHIIGFAILVGAAVVFDLRLLGLSRSIRVSDLARHVLPWARRSFFVLVLPSGLLLFATQAQTLGASRVFQLKLLLIVLAGINTFVFHGRTSRTLATWDENATPPLAAKLAGATSLVLWIAVITCGRLLAYV
jgi:hypothetical protein